MLLCNYEVNVILLTKFRQKFFHEILSCLVYSEVLAKYTVACKISNATLPNRLDFNFYNDLSDLGNLIWSIQKLLS